MAIWRFTAIPLTPIHIGNGEVLAPEDYLLKEDELIRFNRSAVLRDMTSEQRGALESDLDRNRFNAAQETLRKACQPQHQLNRIRISEESKGDLRTLVAHPDSPIRNRQVHTFVFNPLTGQPYIPGSSIKGAIRTALINAFIHPQSQLDGRIAELVRNERIDKRWSLLEKEALNRDPRETEKDPLRFLKVADVPLPEFCTRIDKVSIYKKSTGVKETSGIQMHYERLLSYADGETVQFPVEMELDEEKMRYEGVQVGRIFNFDLLRNHCNDFYWRRMNAELNRFFPREQQSHLKIKTHDLIKLGLADRDMRITWANKILLRIGRFSHFESLSVDDLRQGVNAQRNQAMTEGNSRTVCRCQRNNEFLSVPFGWLLLKLTGESS